MVEQAPEECEQKRLGHMGIRVLGRCSRNIDTPQNRYNDNKRPLRIRKPLGSFATSLVFMQIIRSVVIVVV